MTIASAILLAATLYLCGLTGWQYWLCLGVGLLHGWLSERAGRVAEREEKEIETWTR